MAEFIANTGYCMLRKQVDPYTPITPNVTVPIYSAGFNSNANFDDDVPILGNKAARFDIVRGQRDHQGEISFMGEPNTAGYLLDMLFTRLSTTGAGPYTHVFGPSITTDPNFYTIDILKGQMVERFWGVACRELTPEFSDNKMQLNGQFTALGNFNAREIQSVSTNVLTLKQDYDLTPTKGLLNGDLVRILKADGSVIDTTVTVSPTANTVTVGSATGVAGGDTLYLRAQTVAATILPRFTWGATEFRFGATALAALSATHTPVEPGGAWTLSHAIKPDDAGAKRSGSLDPTNIARGLVDVALETTIPFDKPEHKRRFNQMEKRGAVVRHFSQGTTYELRVTANNLIVAEDPVDLDSDEIVMEAITWRSRYDTADAKILEVTVINGVSTI